MQEYNPTYADSLTVLFEVIDPGQSQTFHNPSYGPEIEITGLLIHGEEPDEFVTMALLDRHEDDFQNEILSMMARKVVA